MIYLSQIIKESNDKHRVMSTHNKPFHEKHGLGKSKEQLELEGILVDSIPEPMYQEGKQAVMYVNPTTEEIYYEYEDIPQTEDDIIKQTVNSLGQSLAQEKIKNMQKETVITQLGGEISKIKLDIMKMKGSAL